MVMAVSHYNSISPCLFSWGIWGHDDFHHNGSEKGKQAC